MKISLKILALFLCLLLVLPSAFACGNGSDNGNTTSSEATEATTAKAEDNAPDGYRIELAEWTVVRSSSAKETLIAAAARLKSGIDKAVGGTIAITDDWAKTEADIPADTKEILVGVTNRPESAAAAEALGKKAAYSISRSGNRVVIYAASDSIIDYAVDYFLENCIGTPGNGAFYLPDELNYVSAEFQTLSIVASNKVNYRVLYPSAAATNGKLKTEYEKFKTDFEALTGCGIVFRTDTLLSGATYDENTLEILLGDTACTQSAEAISRLKPTEYGIFVVGKKLVAVGATRVTTFMAVEKLTELLRSALTKNSDGTASIDFLYGEPIIYSTDVYFSDIPDFTAGTLDGAYDCGDNVLAAYYSGTTAADYTAYCEATVADGFTLYTDHTAGDNRFATYISDEKQGNIYLSFNSASGETRIVTEHKLQNTKAPVTAESYTAVTTPAMTVLSLSYSGSNTNGLGVIFRLSDGSFLVYDGGFTADSDTVMNALNALNVTGGKPVVRMWLLTHMHGDHIQAFQQFSQDHANDITLQYLALNCANSYYDADYTTAYTNGNIASCLSAFSGARLLKVHDGTVLRFADAEIEILQTHEAMYPASLAFTHGNDTSVVSRVKLGGQTVIMTGDIQISAGNCLVKTYGSYLKSDIVQIAHHGSINWPTTTDFYAAVNADWAIFPGSQTRFDENKTTPENKFVINQVGLSKIIIADGGNKTFNLPLN